MLLIVNLTDIKPLNLPGLWTWGLSVLMTGKSTMAFNLNSALITPDNIVECIVIMLDYPSKSLALVDLPYQLTIGAASESPPQSCLAS